MHGVWTVVADWLVKDRSEAADPNRQTFMFFQECLYIQTIVI